MIAKVHKVRSRSNPELIYDVELHDDGTFTCGCMYFMMKGWRSGKECAHIKFIKEKYYAKGKSK